MLVPHRREFVDRRDFWIRRVDEGKPRAAWIEAQRKLPLEEPESAFVLVLQLRRELLYRRVFSCSRQVYGRSMHFVVKLDHHGNALFEVYDPDGCTTFRLHVTRAKLRVAMARVVAEEAAAQPEPRSDRADACRRPNRRTTRR